MGDKRPAVTFIPPTGATPVQRSRGRIAYVVEAARSVRDIHTGKFKVVRLPWWRWRLRLVRTEQVELTPAETLLERNR